MPVDFSRAADAGFRRFGVSAAYTPPGGGDPVPCTAIVKTPDLEDRAFGTPGYALSPANQALALLADVRASDVATPQQGGTLSVAGHSYPIARAPLLDTERQVWRLSLGKPA